MGETRNNVLALVRPVSALANPRPQRAEKPHLLSTFGRTAGARAGTLHEIVPASGADFSAALAFAIDAAAFCAAVRPQAGLVLIGEEFLTREWGLPYGPGLLCMGLDPARLIFVRTANPRQTLLATETALRCRAVACVIAESAAPPALYDLTVSRRLLLAARASGATALFLPVSFAGHAARLSSAATSRLEIKRARGKTLPFGTSMLPMLGQPAFAYRVLKAPGHLTDAAARSRDQWQEDVFGLSPDEAAYHAFSFDPLSPSADRSHSPAGPGEGKWRRSA